MNCNSKVVDNIPKMLAKSEVIQNCLLYLIILSKWTLCLWLRHMT